MEAETSGLNLRRRLEEINRKKEPHNRALLELDNEAEELIREICRKEKVRM